MKRILVLSLFILGLNPSPIHSADETRDSYGATPGDRVRKANGHPRDKDNVISGDVINGIYGRGFNGSAFTTSDGVAVELQASESWTTTANGTEIEFKTTPNGSTTIATTLTLSSDGGLFPYSRTEAQLKASTPTAVGGIWYDSTNKEFVQSTGTTTSFDYGKIEAAGTAPDGW